MTKKAGAGLASVLALAVSAGACASDPAKTAGGNGGSGAGGAGGGGESRTSRVVTDGYLTAGPWSGYGFTATDPGAATIVPDCAGAAGCMPAYTGTDFCMHGTVTGRVDYTGFAMLGWNVAQPATAGAAMGTWAVPATGGVTVTVSNVPASVALRVQLQGTDPHSGADRWCAPLVSGQMIPWGDFKTNCWTGGTPQNPLTAGTPI